MTRRFVGFTLGLTALVAFLIGVAVTGPVSPTAAPSAPPPPVARSGDADEPPAVRADARRGVPLAGVPTSINFADIAERINPAVVNIDATTRSRRSLRLPNRGIRPDVQEEPFDYRRRGSDAPRRGAGTGFFIDAQGHILTNHHVIEGAERITVKLTDGRSLRARVIGSDPDTDIALIKVDGTDKWPHASLGNSDGLRVGEWVCAIGNPLAYEHTVTVGVVSFIGRKLFNQSLDNYIQTDAAINFGNSGGPLINARGEVIGINSAISRQASSIGFAIPINQANAILPQLKDLGRVTRGYIGVVLRDVDPDLQSSLGLTRSDGALVQDITPGSPGERAGLRAYDLITSVDGESVGTNDMLIREIAARPPGTSARLDYVRDGRARQVMIKLAERPTRTASREPNPADSPDRSTQTVGPGELGLTLIEIDDTNAHRFDVPEGMTGLLVQRVESLSPAFDAGIDRGHIILEVNRRPVDSIAAFRRIVDGVGPGGVLMFYLYIPEIEQRNIKTVRLESR
jgi:serine protease Do